MDSDLPIRLVLLAILLSLSGFFSGSETALFSLSYLQKERFRASKGLWGHFIVSLLDRPRRLIVTLLIGNELVNVAASVVTASIFLGLYGEGGKYGAMILSTVLLLFFGEITPKSFAVRNSEAFAMIASLPLSIFSRVIAPFNWAVTKIVDLILSAFFGKDMRVLEPVITEEEFKTLVNVGEDEGIIDEDERKLIHKVLDFADKRASEVMTPRTDMFCYPVEKGLREIVSMPSGTLYSRVPVYEGSVDNIIGILYLKDLIPYKRRDTGELKLRDVIRDPFFIPSTKKINELLKEFQMSKIHMAIVLDEYGGVSGLVTMEDLLEELVGETAAEGEEVTRPLEPIGRNLYKVSAMMPMDQFKEELRCDIPEDDIDTVGGYVFHLFGRIPKKGQKVSLGGLIFTVEKMRGSRILELRVEKREAV